MVESLESQVALEGRKVGVGQSCLGSNSCLLDIAAPFEGLLLSGGREY